MGTSSPRAFTPARIVALVLIGALLLSLAYLRFASGNGPIVVPDGAKRGDLVLNACEFAGKTGSYAADCGTLVVAENPAETDSPLIALPVIRVRATSDDPQEPVFFLTGGPGQSNIDFASQFADRYVADRDFVVVGYRGADGSVRLDCPEVSSALSRSSDILSEQTFRAYTDAYRSCAARLGREGIDVTRYGLVQQVDDMEVARTALGYDRINLLSESAGTRTGLIYAWRYPESIHRSFMVGVNPPGNFLRDSATIDEQLERYAALCAADGSCGQRTDDLAAVFERLASDVPDRWLFLPIKQSNVRVLSLFGLFETASGPTPAPMMIDAWLSAAEGDTSGLWFGSFIGDVLLSDMFIAGQRAAAASIDAGAARDYFADGLADLSNLGAAATASGWAAGYWVDVWPAAAEADAYQHVRTSEVETLVVNGELDFSTPPQVATRELMPFLPNGQEVVLAGFGHTGSFFQEQPDAGTHLINEFFATGQVDTSRYRPQTLDFTPSRTFSGIAKVIVGGMLTLATLAVASLILLAWWVHTRRQIGPRAAAVLRSILPIVLGLGGWALAAVVALATMPGVRITSEFLVVMSVAVPIGCGVYWAWVHLDWSRRTKTAGSIAAVGGAIIGAWLGFHATEGLLALVTAIAGAAAGANLPLIVLDVSKARRGTRPLVPPPVSSRYAQASVPDALAPGREPGHARR